MVEERVNAGAGDAGLPSDLGRQIVVNALLKEYENIHHRVLDQIQLYEATNIRILTLLGVLFFFGLTNFGELDAGYIFFVVNIVFIVLVPLLSIASLLFAAANLVKIMIWGDFLKRVENKVNAVLASEARFFGFDRGQVMSWEYWRVTCGYAGKSNLFSIVTFSVFLVVVFVLSSVVSVLLRLHFVQGMAIVWYPFWLNVAIGVSVVFVATAWYSWTRYSAQRAKSVKGACDDAAI